MTRPDVDEKRPNDGMDAAEVWSTLWQDRRLIFRIAGFFFAAVVLVTFASRMDFRSRGRMYLGEIDGKPSAVSGSSDLDLSNGEQSGLASEAQILQSDSLITRAILDSGINVAIAPTGWHAPRYLQWLLRKRDPKSVDVALAELAAVDTSLEDNYRGVRTYTAVFVTATNYELWTKPGLFDLGSGGARLLGKGRLAEAATLAGLHLTLIPGTASGPRAGASYEIKVTPLDDVVDAVLKALTVSFPKPVTPGETTKVVSLEFTHSSPHLAATFLQHLMRGYVDAHQSWKTEDATAAEAFVSNQLGVIRESLDKTEKRMAEYRSNSRVVVLDNEASAMIEQIGKYEEQRVAARLQVASLSDMKRALKNPNARMEAFLMGEGDDTVLQNLASTLSKARQDLATLEQKYNPNAPDVREQRAQVDAQLDMIRNYVSNRLTRAQDNLASLGAVVAQYEQKLKTVPGAELGLAQLARESEVYSKIYSYLLERQQQTAIIKASRVSKNRVLDAPLEPYRADSPKLLVRLAVSLFGLFLGCAFVLLRRVFSSKLQSEAEVRGSTAPLPIFAAVPSYSACVALPFDALAAEPNSDFAEAFRMLRTNLYYASAKQGCQVVVATSPSSGDGKTTTVFALAAMLAADKKTVLIIDADLRRPTHHTLTEQPLEPGLDAVLSSQCEWADAVRSIAPGVYSMAAGLATSPDVLSSEQMSAMLTEARTIFDFILLDAPSFPLVSASLVLCMQADSVLSVLRIQSTPRKLAAEHVGRLSSLPATYGIVVNGVGIAQGIRGPRPPKRAPRAEVALDLGQVAPRVARRGARARWWLAAVLSFTAAAAAGAILARASDVGVWATALEKLTSR